MTELEQICIDCGITISQQAIRCKSCSNKHRAGNYSWSKEAKEKRKGEGNPFWSGDEVGYGALHDWIRSRKPKPDLCENCGKQPPIDLANISGEYKRDVADYEWICRDCHMKKDGRMQRRSEDGRFAVP